MLIAAFPPIGIDFLAWIGMAPFFFALDGKGRKSGFLLGLLWGFVFFIGTVYWVVNSMANYGGIPIFTSILILLLLVFYLSLFPAIFGFFASKISSGETGLFLKIFFVSSFWVSLEYLRTNMITVGFPWVLLGYSQSPFLPLIQISDITGVYGVSFLIVMVNMFVFSALSHWFRKNKALEMPSRWKYRAGRLPIKEGLFIFTVLIAVLLYGFFRIYQIDNASKNWKPLKIIIAQGNIDQGKKWDAAFQKGTVDIYKNLSLAAVKNKADLIVWPETAAPFYLQSDKKLGPEIFNVPKEANAYLFTGSPAYGLGSGGEAAYYNSAILISPKGEIIEKYDKIHLVPFGEYVPLKKYLPFIHKLVVGVGDFTPGKWLKPLEFDGNSFGVLICFESIFPELARGFIQDGAGFLINITNDAWFGKTSAPYQHFSQAAFRAVENKVFLVRAANTGISGVIDPVGRVQAKGGIFTTESMVEDIKVKPAPAGSKQGKDSASPIKAFGDMITFYAQYGDVFAIGCMILSVGCWLLVMRRKKL